MREIALVMPKMSMTMESGQVVSWYTSEGDSVRAGDVVCEVTTDKVNMDVEATVDGTLARIVARQGDVVAVGEPIAYVASESDDLFEGISIGTAARPAEPASEPAAVATTVAPGRDEVANPPSRRGPIAAAPWARRRAAELGIDLASIAGTGVDGAVTKKDVEQAASQLAPAPSAPQPPTPQPPARQRPAPQPPVPAAAGAPAEPAADSTFAPAFAAALQAQRQAVRQVVARKMTESAAIPQFTAFADLDLQALTAARERIGWTALLVYAVARTLRDHPALNSTWQDDRPTPAGHVGIALAVDTPVGLLAPVLVDPDRLTLDQVDARTKQLVAHARGGRLAADALQGGTFTVSNLGVFGVRMFDALITPPQVGALSVGLIGQVPVAVRGALTVRTSCTVGLTVDHRAADGADAGRFLADLVTLLAEPARLFASLRDPR